MKPKCAKVEYMKYLSDFILYDTAGSKGSIMVDIFKLGFPGVVVDFPHLIFSSKDILWIANKEKWIEVQSWSIYERQGERI